MKKIIGLIVCIVLATAGIEAKKRLVIVHTNDTHSQIVPVSKQAMRDANRGGIARREVLLNELRREEKNILLFDAGDFSQGTPFYNIFKGEVEVKMMNLLKYDAITLGNHEFDNGAEALAGILKKAKFRVLCANYDVSNSPLRGIVKPYAIIKKNGIKVGVIGVGIKPDGLISKKNFGGIVYLDPIETVNRIAAELKENKGCDVVIVLSHLGIEYDAREQKTDDCTLAAKSKNIDVIIGGHTHTFLKEIKEIKNTEGKTVYINQAGKLGLVVDKLELEWEE